MENPYRSPEALGAAKPSLRLPWLRVLIVAGSVGFAVGLIVPRISPYVRVLWDSAFP